jgi:hypothetical protein
MSASTEAVMRHLCDRAGISQEQLDALRRGDVELLREAWAATNDPAPRARDDDVRRLSARLEETRTRLALAGDLLRQLADVLGACARCWGTNARCPSCHGSGGPGFRQPDPQLGTWLAAAIARVPSTTSPAPDPHHPTGQGDHHD